MKLKIGDKVKYTSGRHGDSEYNPLWDGIKGHIEGVVTSIHMSEFCYSVRWDNGKPNSYRIKDVELIYSVPEELFKL